MILVKVVSLLKNDHEVQTSFSPVIFFGTDHFSLKKTPEKQQKIKRKSFC